MRSQVCTGIVKHQRHVEKSHQFKYNVFMMLLDLDELNHIFDNYWLWSVEKFNLASFKRKNYFDKGNEALIDSVKKLIDKRTGNKIDKVFLLTNLSCLGYCFNPISIYFCHNKGKLVNCIIEVTNTPWGESHQYILDPILIKKDIYKMSFKKVLHVSPFMTMDYEYQLKCKYSENSIIVYIENIKDGSCHFDATLSLTRLNINHKSLASTLIKFPFMTGKVILAIYWQALKLWIKGVNIINHRGKKL